MKRKFREVFTVIRPLPSTTLAAAVEAFGCVQDETGEYLYGGASPNEKIEVRLEMQDDTKRWIPVKTN